MRALRCVLGILPLLGALGAGGCNRPRGCPPDMDVVADRSVKGKTVLCKSRSGSAHRFIELQEGTVRPHKVCLFQAGQPEGDFQAFHPDGKVWIQGRYVDGEKSGVWTQFDAEGRKVADGEYRRGRLVAGAPVAMAAACESVEL